MAAAMTDDEMAAAVEIKLTPFIPKEHVPEPPQHAFLWLDHLEAFYGGAAGGGKSDALLMAALQYVDQPGYSALILRRSYADLSLPGAIMDRAKEWLEGTGAKWNDNLKTWRFPSGATLTFGYLQRPNDKYRYQGSEFQFIGFDELTQFKREDYIYLFSRLRRLEGTNVPVRMRSASNPGGTGHDWVKKRLVLNHPDEAVSQEIIDALGLPEELLQRIFIPARLDDNPHIDRGMYLLALAQLDDETREQLLAGDWDVRPPGNWVIPDPTWVDASVEYYHELSQAGIPEPSGGKLYICIDFGEHTQAYTLWPLEGGGVYVPPSETVTYHQDVAQTTPDIMINALKFGLPLGAVRYDAAGVQSSITFRNIARGYDGLAKLPTNGIAFSKYKRLTMDYLRLLFRRTYEGHDITVIAIHPSNVELIRQLKIWERKDEESDETTKTDDHGPDALVAGVAPIARAHQKKILELTLAAYKHSKPEGVAA